MTTDSPSSSGDGPDFISLWATEHANGQQLLHLLNRRQRKTLPLPRLTVEPTSVEEFIPELADMCADIGGRSLLLLETTLPRDWLFLHWERLSLRGQPLSDQMLVVRKGDWRLFSRVKQRTPRFLNLFPESEFNFSAHLQPLIGARLRPCRRELLAQQMAETDELFVLAHGLEHGLTDSSGTPFLLPDSPGMPSRIWLLACNVGGRMNTIAQQLLERGCRTVVTAAGDISAPEMASLIEQRLSEPSGPDDPSLWLAQTGSSADGGIRSLNVWGAVDLDRSTCAQWNRCAWDEAHDEFDLPLDDETSIETFRHAAACFDSSSLWTLARDSMQLPLLLLASTHDPNLIPRLTPRLDKLVETPQSVRAVAAAARRVGNYVEMARYLSRGLQLPGLADDERADHLGQLTNLLIDLNLPSSALAVIDQHEDLSPEDLSDPTMARFKRLDWKARAEARCGRFHLAVDILSGKRREAGPEDGRELAGLLYVSSWGAITGTVARSVARGYAVEVAERLRTIGKPGLGRTSVDTSYLLRSMAVHAWTNQDSASVAAVTPWQVLAEAHLSDADPGPWAYVLSFLFLAGKVSVPVFERAQRALRDAKYYLEAAMLQRLAGSTDAAAQLVERFQDRRAKVLNAITAPSVSTVDMGRLIAEANDRMLAERTAMDAVSMAAAGVLPM